MEYFAGGLIAIGVIGLVGFLASKAKPTVEIYPLSRGQGSSDSPPGSKSTPQPTPEPPTMEQFADSMVRQSDLEAKVYAAQSSSLAAQTFNQKAKAELNQAKLEVRKSETALQREDRVIKRLDLEDEIAELRLDKVERARVRRDTATFDAETQQLLNPEPEPQQLSPSQKQAFEALEKIALAGQMTNAQIQSLQITLEQIEAFKNQLMSKYPPEQAKQVLDAFLKTLHQNKIL